MSSQLLDPGRILATIDDIESLTTGLSRKIGQKIMVLEQHRGAPEAGPA